jgi:colicin import membrane protein
VSETETLDAPPTAPETRQLITIKQQLPTLLAADTDDLLGHLAAKVERFVVSGAGDISTAKGRAETKSLAAEIASTKAEIIRKGKALTEDWRAKTKAVNAECNVLEERMDALKVRVRAPLTEWERQEKDRIEGHEHAVNEIIALGMKYTSEAAPADIKTAIDLLPGLADRDWREFQDRAGRVVAEATDRLAAAYAGAQKREQDAAELAAFRRQQAEQTRIGAHRAGIQSIIDIADPEKIAGTGPDGTVTSSDIAVRLDLLQKPYTRDWEEFAEEAATARANAIGVLKDRHALCLAAEAEIQRKREEAIAAEAAERARQEAETRAAAEAEAARKRAEEDRLALEAHAAGEARAAAKRQEEAEARATAAEQARVDAEARAVREREEATAQAERDRQQAIADERRRVEQVAARDRAAADKRAADKAHRGKINRTAADALMAAAFLTEETAQLVVAAIARGEIPAVSIAY